MHEPHKNCPRIAQLSEKPRQEEIAKLRKGLRKSKLPEYMRDGFYGNHAALGRFKVFHNGSGLELTWCIAGGEEKSASLDRLCQSPEKEADRLEVGWLILNMFELDQRNEREHIASPKEIMRVISRYSRHIDSWRNWALVPAGHFILSE